jgi:hypothetical protein
MKDENFMLCVLNIYIYGVLVRMHTRDDVHRVSTCSVKWADRRDGKKRREREHSTRKLKNDPPKQRERKGRRKKKKTWLWRKREKNERTNEQTSAQVEDELMSQKDFTNKQQNEEETDRKRKVSGDHDHH